ncbi:hypothetical protein [Myxococcus sp. CA040A]|uniref:hypothetical protein n=1 Tax=Myxococcus sp. CA040A TaxID=2741738 RepID=UPI00157AC557|nr:hypothetical protein [Myxococcus sp. CA040A]NTX07010.1 hypothetical protein [Myxococcus sp. CA040A]
MKWQNWREHLGLPLFIGTLVAIPFAIHVVRTGWETWTKPPLDLCLGGRTPWAFTKQDRRLLNWARETYEKAREEMRARHAAEAGMVSVAKTNGDATEADLVRLQGYQQMESTETYARQQAYLEKLCHDAAARVSQ